VHAEASAREAVAREALRDAVLRRDRARLERTLPAHRALDLRQCLIEERWTLVDVFERDGRRFVVALPNRPLAIDAPLTERERQAVKALAHGLPHKEIVYDLGLAPSTVATLIARAARKLRASSPRELVLRARALEDAAVTSATSSRRPRTPSLR
jgi:DNA-binding NarL/FixJ family response regulator